MRILKRIYDSELYTISIVALALVSLFLSITNKEDFWINIIFILDLIVATSIYIHFTPDKKVKGYFKLHFFDMVSCIPIQFLTLFKIFRLIRLVRISRLFKLKRMVSISNRITLSNIFKFDTFKELAIYLIIYLIGNAYIFQEVENVSTLDSFYWVITTITTVGYGDIYPTHTITKIMAMFLMIVGVAIMSYINGLIISFVIEQNKK